MLSPLSFDTDSFENIIEEYRSRIVGIFPDWTNYNYSDPGITFLELFAWLRENQQYFMEQLGDDHYREFFRLAGFTPYGRKCAKILAEAVPGSFEKAIAIPAGTRFLSGGLCYETVKTEWWIKTERLSLPLGEDRLSIRMPIVSFRSEKNRRSELLYFSE